jgi:hypothetical protein
MAIGGLRNAVDALTALTALAGLSTWTPRASVEVHFRVRQGRRSGRGSRLRSHCRISRVCRLRGVNRLVHPEKVSYLGLVMAAAAVDAIGNELSA